MGRKPSRFARSNPQRAAAPRPERRSAVWLAAGLLVLAAAAAYCNSFGGPLIFDDEQAIVKNPTIRQLWPLWQPLRPPAHGETVTNRPLLNLSLALNYAVGGLATWGYHAVNLAIHLAAALLLFGIVRRTLRLPAMRDRWGQAATGLALAVALLWAVHPLQTESVTYIVQRAESLAGMLYLLVLYGLIRATEGGKGDTRLWEEIKEESKEGETSPPMPAHKSPPLPLSPSPLSALPWYAVAWLACLLGMAAKEVMVSAPVVALLYDRTFLAGSFREAWRRRRGFYLALAGTWLLLAGVVAQAPTRGSTAGFGAGVSAWAYLGTQFGAIVHYLKLCVWPCPLVLDYGTDTAAGASQIVPYLIVVALLAAATGVALWRWPKVGFLGAFFFAVLAPTSSVVPVATQTVAEHRMYLPLAAVVSLAVCGAHVGLRGKGDRHLLCAAPGGPFRQKVLVPFSWLAGGLTAAVAITFGIMTFDRNVTYQSDLAIWRDTLAKRAGEHAGPQ